ncbi:MAG: anaerobic sulfatase maturase [Actinomycetaceae bacterium]|nr:anaerobic sulfatase maturase [Actinomycetaceae bacterium]MDY6143411.1 anaerobic sulfatase maturase [Arcanobacterium sp.]
MMSYLPFSVVAKPTGAACNLDCHYCFFLSKEALYDVKRQLMSEETLETYVKQYLAASPDGEVTMLWQGGEPTMRGLDFFRAMVSFVDKYRRPSQNVSHALQTNATLIDAQWAEFLAEHDFLVGVSIDGPAKLHDAYRVNKAGRGTHAQVVKGWRILQDAGVRCNVLCTVHHANEKRALQVYRYFRDVLDAHYIQFIPIVERIAPGLSKEQANLPQSEQDVYRQDGSGVTKRSTSPSAYGKFLCTVYDEWLSTDVGKVFVQDFDSALAAMFGQPSVCVHAPSCGNNFAMEFNGDVYACDHWVEPQWLLGNISQSTFEDIARTERMQKFSEKKQNLPPRCEQCKYLRLCWGGCPKDRFVGSGVAGSAGDSNAESPRYNYLCKGYYAFYDHAWSSLTKMARLVASGRPAADVMQTNRQ